MKEWHLLCKGKKEKQVLSVKIDYTRTSFSSEMTAFHHLGVFKMGFLFLPKNSISL